MQSTVDHIQEIVGQAKELIEVKAELIKLKAAAKLSATASTVISIVAIFIVGGLAITVLSVGIAYKLGIMMDNISYGFFCVGGFYILMTILIIIFRKQLLIKPLANLFVDKIIK